VWTALSLWLTTLVAAALYGALAVRSVVHGGNAGPWVAGAVALYFGAILFLCASYFAISWIWRARRPREVRLGMRGTLKLWWAEYGTLAGSPLRLMLYGLLVRDPDPAPVQSPVLLVHGVLCNAGVWVRLARYLRRNGIDGVYSLSYGPPLASIERFADQLAGKIDAIVAETGAKRVIVVAHSMGGLVTRAYLRRHGTARIARVVTLGSPHHGSMMAWFFPGVSLAQMRPGNAWLAALNATRLDPSLRLVSLWSWHDSMVAPQTSSELPGAVDVAIVGVGHNALLADPGVLAFVQAEIDAERREAPVGPASVTARPDRCSV
jgi:triacylglycerol esterase/lipase EstA (alpha/beta hydrolase family)